VIVRTTLRPFGIVLGAELGREQAEEELRGAIDLHEGAEPETRHERQMMRSILDLDEVEVEEIMTHRKKVSMIDLADEPDGIVDQVLDSQFTRIPVYRDDQDNVVGVLHTKELLRELRRHKGDVAKIDFDELPTEPWFIPDTTSLLDQLQAFRDRREHFAVVVDEYGSLMGIVTLEDILEEIVGEIEDEHDTPVSGVRPQPDGGYIVDGTVTIRDLNREFDWNLPDEEAATIAGLVMHESRLIPEKGQAFTFHGFRFEVLRRVRNQLTSVRVTPPSAVATADEREKTS
jgi:Mg2+/Co2+ transporter CorB